MAKKTKKPTSLTLEQAVDSIANWAFSDSHVKVDREVLKDQLQTDFGVSGRYPTEKECEEMVTGGDEGECSEETQELFPQAYEFIGTYWE